MGSELTVYSRKLKIVDYGDDFTKSKLVAAMEKTIAKVPIGALAPAMTAVYSNGLRINKMKTVAGPGGKEVAMEVVWFCVGTELQRRAAAAVGWRASVSGEPAGHRRKE